MSKVVQAHKRMAPETLAFLIATCSTSKFKQLMTGDKPDDMSGDVIETLVLHAGYEVKGRRLISDSKSMIRKLVKEVLQSKGVDALVITGGTGLSPRDVTVESVSGFLDKELPGFGELFRKISFDRIGSAAMLSRAVAGSVKGKLIFCLPGSPDGVRTAMEHLILPEIGHMIKVCRES